MAVSVFPAGSGVLKKRQELALSAFGQSGAISVSIKSGATVAINDRSFTVPTDDPTILIATVNGSYHGWAVVSKSQQAVRYGEELALSAYNQATTKDGKTLYFRELTGMYQNAGVVATTSAGTMVLSGLPWGVNVHTYQQLIDIANFILPD